MGFLFNLFFIIIHSGIDSSYVPLQLREELSPESKSKVVRAEKGLEGLI